MLFFAFMVFFSSLTMIAQHNDLTIDEAQEEAKEHNKRIVLIFQGSDWCAPCIKLEKEILETEEFETLAKDQFVIVKADFPRSKKNQLPEERKKHNAGLAEKYNKSGYFPFVVVLNSEGAVLGALGYQKSTPTDYFNKLNSFK